MIHFSEKLKGAEKAAMQVLHVVMTYDYKENTCNEKKNTHSDIMYIRKYWVGRIHCLPTQCHDWVGGCPPCPLGSREPARCCCDLYLHGMMVQYLRVSRARSLPIYRPSTSLCHSRFVQATTPRDDGCQSCCPSLLQYLTWPRPSSPRPFPATDYCSRRSI